MIVRACAVACVGACVGACVCACVRACAYVYVGFVSHTVCMTMSHSCPTVGGVGV